MSKAEEWDRFWKGYTKVNPKAKKLSRELAKYLEQVYKNVSPWMGKELQAGIKIESNGKIKGTALGWVMMGIMPHFILKKVQEEFGSDIKEIKESARKPSTELAEAFAKAIEVIQGVKHEIFFTSPEERALRSKVDEMFSRAEEEILIAAWIDTVLLDKISEARRRGIEFRLITHTPSGTSRKSIKEAFRRIQTILGKDKIKTCPLLHNRILVVDRKELLFGADLTSDSLDTNFDAGVWTNNPLLIKQIVRRFEEMWKDERSTHPK